MGAFTAAITVLLMCTGLIRLFYDQGTVDRWFFPSIILDEYLVVPSFT